MDTISFAGLIAEIRDWCRGLLWYVRLPVWLYLLYAGVRQFREPVDYYSLFAAINLCIHEGGHLLFRPFGDFMHIAGGTILQLSAPVISMYILLQQRDYFGISFCLGWLSTNLIGVGVYMADARDMELPLVSAEGGGDNSNIIHDWNYLFGRLGLLNDDKIIGFLTRGLGSGVMALALISGVWLMWEMGRPGSRGGSSI